MKDITKKHVYSMVVLIIFSLLAYGSMETDVDTHETRGKAAEYQISADKLFQEYDANEVAADNKYKGHIVIVEGTITDIGKDITDQAYLVIGGDGFLDGVQCLFTKGEEPSFSSISKGDHIRVKGEVSGKMGNVLLRKCSLR